MIEAEYSWINYFKKKIPATALKEDKDKIEELEKRIKSIEEEFKPTLDFIMNLIKDIKKREEEAGKGIYA